ncbi:MAG: hypothetical protein E7017_03275 [Alphaproteobacteria bacterium]|nr:hypothetical protein [Alphaproteobacteria bacterium]
MEKVKFSQSAIMENGSYQEIENLLMQVKDIGNDDILVPLANRKDICAKLIENEKLPESVVKEFVKTCSFEEFLLLLSRSNEYLTYEILCACGTRKEYLQQIVQSNNVENILRIARIPYLPLNIQIYILTSSNDELIRPFIKYNDTFDETIEKLIIFSKNKKWYQWATEDRDYCMYVEPSDKFEEEIIESGDEDIICFAMDVCLLPNPLKIIELDNPKLTEHLVYSFPYNDVIDWVIKNKREDLLSIIIEEHFLDERVPEALLKFKKHKFMQRFIQKLQEQATKWQTEEQRMYFSRSKELEKILKYYDVPYKAIDKSSISLIQE